MWLLALLTVATAYGDLFEEDLDLLSQPVNQQSRPVIGILTLPNDGMYNLTGTSYIDAGYVKWIEMGGARVVPLRIDHPWSELQYLVENLDGVLFTGGDQPFLNENGTMTAYAHTACSIYNLVTSLNDAGKHYPMWGTCLGFQLLHICVSPLPDTVQYMPDMPGHSALSTFTPAGLASRIFATELGPGLRFLMERTNVTFVSHNSGVPPRQYVLDLDLYAAYRILTTMKTIDGVEYVGLIEGKRYPIFGSQFHPEKNIYEWWPEEDIPHSLGSVVTATYFSTFFIEEARQNANQFPSEAELQPYLIYNWAPYYYNQDPVQVYLFE